MILWQGNGHSRTTAQGLNTQLDKGIEERYIISPLSSEARFRTIILLTSIELPQPPSPQAGVVQI